MTSDDRTLENVPPVTSEVEKIEDGNVPSSGRTKSQRTQAAVQFLSLCIMLFMVGITDGSPGALIPRMQEQYGVNYTVISLIFILNAAVSLLCPDVCALG
jgi:hypothetical protein